MVDMVGRGGTISRSANRGATDVVGEMGDTEKRMSVRSFNFNEGLEGDW